MSIDFTNSCWAETGMKIRRVQGNGKRPRLTHGVSQPSIDASITGWVLIAYCRLLKALLQPRDRADHFGGLFEWRHVACFGNDH